MFSLLFIPLHPPPLFSSRSMALVSDYLTIRKHRPPFCFVVRALQLFPQMSFTTDTVYGNAKLSSSVCAPTDCHFAFFRAK